jgi:glycopeptide antibiotics resistance protein
MDVPAVGVPLFDKLGHLCIFGVLALLWLLFASHKIEGKKSHLFWVLILVFVYGIIIEVFQGLFLQSRTADGWDIVANSAGILFGWLIYQKIKKVF